MAVNAAYQLSYTGEQVEDLLGQVTVNKDDIAQINTDLGGKVDKVEGKGLSENDFTTADKNKLAGIASGAEVNVNADWDAVSGDAQILNKPTIPSRTSQLTNDSGYITDAGVTSFNGQTGAVTYSPPAETDPVFKASPAYGISSSDISSWNAKQPALTFDSTPTAGSSNPVTSSGIKAYVDAHQSDTSEIEAEIDAIEAKIPNAASSSNQLADKAFVTASLAAKQDTIDDLTVIRQGAAAGATAYQKPSGGIPKSDLSSSVQTSLDKADSAIQTETDPVFSASPAAGITSSDISSWNAKQSALTFDSTPTASSTNPVTSGGVYTALGGKVSSNTSITGATKTKITYDSKGLVTAGADLAASDIPSLTLSKISDVTATASELNVLDGITATTTELNYTDGVTGNIQTQLDAKANQSTTYTKTEVDALFDDVAYLGEDDGQATTLDFDPQADTVWNIPQTLGSSQQAQARANIGVVDVSGTNDGTNWTSITIGSTTKAIPSGGGDVNVIESITFNGTAATIDSTTKNAAISYTPPVTSVNNQTGAVSLALGDTNVIETVKVNSTALTPDANKAVDITTVTSVTVNSVNHTPVNGVVDLGTISGGSTGAPVVVVTQAYYDSLSSYDSNTIYVISDSLVTTPEVTIMTAVEYAAATKSSTTVYFVS